MLPGLMAWDVDAMEAKDAEALLLAISPRVAGKAGEIAMLCGHLPLALRGLAGTFLHERDDLGVIRYVDRLRAAEAVGAVGAGGKWQ